MLFKNRMDAAAQLVPHLDKYKTEPAVIFAVPRGGVPLGFVLARHFDFPLELLLTKKIGHPLNKEVAIGAVSLEDYEVEEKYILPPTYIRDEIQKISATLYERYRRFMGDRHQPPDLHGKTVIIVDDGVATGNTMLSAIRIMRKKNPSRIVVAIPVASPRAVDRITELADDFVCLYAPDNFHGVGQFYHDFTQVTDDEVAHLLKEVNRGERYRDGSAA